MVVKYAILLFLILALFSEVGLSQAGPADSPEVLDSIYKANIHKSRINGVYIPKDITDAYEEFVHLSPPEALDQFRLAPEQEVASKLHFGIGRWMMVNWSFYEGSRLSHALRNIGLLHPDDMADFLITVFHRKLNDRPENHEELIEVLAERRKKIRKKQDPVRID